MKAVARYLHGRAVHGRRVRTLAARIAALLPTAATVVDVGSGDGLLAAAIRAARPDLTIRGFDVLARDRTHIPVDLFDGVHLPLGDASVDVVLLVDVLHHTDDPRPLLAECARVARGAVVVKDHLREGLAAGPTLRFMDWVGNAPHGVRLPYNYLSREQWRALLGATRLAAESWDARLRLYPRPADWLFGRQLHFIARLVKPPA